MSARETVTDGITEYKNSARRFFLVTVGAFVCLILSVVLNLIQYNDKPEPPELLAITENGRILSLPTIADPFYTPSQITDWARGAIEGVYSFNFNNYTKHQAVMTKKWTTAKTAQRWTEGINKIGLLGLVVNEGRVAEAIALKAPTILRKGTKGGRAYWEVVMPTRIRLVGTKDTKSIDYSIKVIVVRDDLRKRRAGRVIAKISAAPYKE